MNDHTTSMTSGNDLYTEKDKSDFLKFLELKTEKLVTAVYMITNFLSDKEPIKWRLRDVSLSMLSSAVVLKEKNSAERSGVLSSMIALSGETLSLLEIAHLSGFVSEMNYSVLKREYEAMVEHLSARAETRRAVHKVSLPESFFAGTEYRSLPSSDDRRTDTLSRPALDRTDARDVRGSGATSFPRSARTDIKDISNAQGSKTNDLYIDRAKKDMLSQTPSSGMSTPIIGRVEKVKNKRRDAILNVLKDKSDLTIKDIATEVTDCSEKTIQRELVALLENGVIKRTGERRWSRYSLV